MYYYYYLSACDATDDDDCDVRRMRVRKGATDVPRSRSTR